MNDFSQMLQNLNDEDIDYLYPIIRFKYYEKCGKNNFCHYYFGKIDRQIEFINTALFVLLNQLFINNGETGLERVALSMANITRNYMEKYIVNGSVTLGNVVPILKYFNFFVLCGEVEVKNKSKNELTIKINNCLFQKNKIFCSFTNNFLLDLFRLIFKGQMVMIRKKIIGGEKTCLLNFVIKQFKYIKVLHLE